MSFRLSLHISAEDSLFLMYSQKSCYFECTLNSAINQEKCLPWDFPVPTKDGVAIDVDVCLSQNVARINQINKFHQAMKNRSYSQNCQCMPDCEAVSYDVQVDNVPLLPAAQLCREEERFKIKSFISETQD
jgi:hypothetical protein